MTQPQVQETERAGCKQRLWGLVEPYPYPRDDELVREIAEVHARIARRSQLLMREEAVRRGWY